MPCDELAPEQQICDPTPASDACDIRTSPGSSSSSPSSAQPKHSHSSSSMLRGRYHCATSFLPFQARQPQLIQLMCIDVQKHLPHDVADMRAPHQRSLSRPLYPINASKHASLSRLQRHKLSPNYGSMLPRCFYTTYSRTSPSSPSHPLPSITPPQKHVS